MVCDRNEDDGLSVAASVSSEDTDALAQRIAAKHATKSAPKPLEPSRLSDSRTEGETRKQKFVETIQSTPLDDISNNFAADDDWSNHRARNGDDDDEDSVDTATLERRILERRRKQTNQASDPLDDEFVLPDDDSSTSTRSSEKDACVPPPRSFEQQQPVVEVHNMNMPIKCVSVQVPVSNEQESGIIPPDVKIRLGLHRSRPTGSIRKRRAMNLEDDIIEDFSSEDELRFGRPSILQRQQRVSLSFMKAPVTELTTLGSSSDKKRISSCRREKSIGDFFKTASFGAQFSPPIHSSPPRQSQQPSGYQRHETKRSSNLNRPQATSHYSVVASSYDNVSPYQQPVDDRSFTMTRTTEGYDAHKFPSIQNQQIYNTFRRPDPPHRQPTCHAFEGPTNTLGQASSVQKLTKTQSVSIASRPQHNPDGRQPDFSITASAYEEVPYRPFFAPPVEARRIRDPSARPKRKQGKRRKGRAPAKGRPPAKGRKKAATARSHAAPAVANQSFRRAPDDHLSGVGGASFRL